MARSAPRLRQGGAFLVAAGGYRDISAKGLGELDRGRADATGAAMHKKGFAGFKSAALEHICQTVKNVSGSAAAWMPRSLLAAAGM